MTPTYTAKVLFPAAAEPISLEDARQHLRITPYIEDSDGGLSHPDDDLIRGLLTAAREACENFTGLSLAVKTYEQVGREFPPRDHPLELLHPPLVDVEQVTYGPGSDDVLLSEGFSVDEWSTPQQLYTAADWPVVERATAAVRIRFRAGYRAHDADSDDAAPALPFVFRAAILLMLGHLYENRETVTPSAMVELPQGAFALLRSSRVRKGMA